MGLFQPDAGSGDTHGRQQTSVVSVVGSEFKERTPEINGQSVFPGVLFWHAPRSRHKKTGLFRSNPTKSGLSGNPVIFFKRSVPNLVRYLLNVLSVFYISFALAGRALIVGSTHLAVVVFPLPLAAGFAYTLNHFFPHASRTGIFFWFLSHCKISFVN